MNIENLNDRVKEHDRVIKNMTGQLITLRTLCLALIASHPDRKSFMKAAGQLRERTIANALPSAASDATIDAIEKLMNEALRPLPWEKG